MGKKYDEKERAKRMRYSESPCDGRINVTNPSTYLSSAAGC